jgi:hypothetical protein
MRIYNSLVCGIYLNFDKWDLFKLRQIDLYMIKYIKINSNWVKMGEKHSNV